MQTENLLLHPEACLLGCVKITGSNSYLDFHRCMQHYPLCQNAATSVALRRSCPSCHNASKIAARIMQVLQTPSRNSKASQLLTHCKSAARLLQELLSYCKSCSPTTSKLLISLIYCKYCSPTERFCLPTASQLLTYCKSAAHLLQVSCSPTARTALYCKYYFHIASPATYCNCSSTARGCNALRVNN
jgi:hypothetical protein